MGSGDLDNEHRNYRGEAPWLQNVWALLAGLFVLAMAVIFLLGTWKLGELING